MYGFPNPNFNPMPGMNIGGNMNWMNMYNTAIPNQNINPIPNQGMFNSGKINVIFRTTKAVRTNITIDTDKKGYLDNTVIFFVSTHGNNMFGFYEMFKVEDFVMEKALPCWLILMPKSKNLKEVIENIKNEFGNSKEIIDNLNKIFHE